MKRSKAVFASLILVGTAVSGVCLAEESTAFTPGEQSTYRVQYLGVSAGTAQITVGSQTQQWGTPVWPIVTMARTDPMMSVYPIKDRFVTYWDVSQRRSIGSDLYADENRKRRRQRIRLDHAARSATVLKQKEGESATEAKLEIVAGTADVAAATFALRNMALEVGGTYEIPVFTGAKTFVLKATVEARQRIQTSMGEREVFKVRAATDFSGKLQSKRDLFAYFTTDGAHVPVRIEAEFVLGNIVADLTEYKPGGALAVNLPPDPRG